MNPHVSSCWQCNGQTNIAMKGKVDYMQ